MPRSNKLWAGLYGVAFHLLAVVVVAAVAARNQVEISSRFWWTTVPPLLVAAFVVYALLVGPYLPRRPTTKGAVLYDSAVGMFAELGIVVGTAVLYGLVAPAAAADRSGSYLADAASTALFAFLWTFGSFFTQILVVGNTAGLVGFVLLKRLAARRAKTQG
jgi:hypothetical protein